MASEDGIIIDIINTIKGTKSSAELNFEDLNVSLPGFSLGIVISGKVSLKIKPIPDDAE